MFRRHPSSGQGRDFVLRLSPWLIVGLALVLGLAMAVLEARNAQREKGLMSQSLFDRAEALIWALEALVKSGPEASDGRGRLQSILEETAKRKGIDYIAVTDERCRILSHSDPARAGKVLHAPAVLAGLVLSDEARWRLYDNPSTGKVFEVYKRFAFPPGALGDKWDLDKADTAPPLRMLIFVGLDGLPFEEALEEDRRTTAIIASVLALMGLAGFVSLFWAQNYRLSRRMLQDTKAFASEVVTNLPAGVVSIGPSGRVTLVNDAASRILGTAAEELQGAPFASLPGLDWESLATAMDRGEVVLEREMNVVLRGDKSVPVSLSASRIVNEDGVDLGRLFILRDLGEVRTLQEQVRRGERLSALGNLAAGVAHEIRNPLSSIKGFATYLAGRFQSEGPDKEAALIMIQEADRLNRVVSELLEFARPVERRLAPGDLNAVLSRVLRLAASDAENKGVAVQFVPDRDLAPIPMDAERLTQAFLNLCVNAIQATEPGGTLTAATRREADGWVVIEIADNGPGMSAETLEKIFDPYFTTKSTGAGLGLAITHKIVDNHGGEIKVASRPGQGATFTVLLPVDMAA